MGGRENISSLRLRLNNEIRSREVRVINDDGKQLGVISTREALDLANKKELDLVEVNPHASPSVCRLMDYGKYKYKQTKKEREAKKRQHVIKIKEVKIKPQIEEHDFYVKLDNAKKFLEKGNKVKVTLIYRGREVLHREIGEAVLDRFCNEIVDSKLGAIEAKPKVMGKIVSLVIAPTKSN